MRFDTPVTAIDREGTTCRVRTADGEYETDRVIVAAGAWTPSLVPELADVLDVERQVLVWFDPLPESPDCVWVSDWTEGHYVYGFPPDVDGIKLALHHDGRTITADGIDRAVTDRSAHRRQRLLRARLQVPARDGRGDCRLRRGTRRPWTCRASRSTACSRRRRR